MARIQLAYPKIPDSRNLREGKYLAKGIDKNNVIRMPKIKTHEYMKKLQQAFQDDWE